MFTAIRKWFYKTPDERYSDGCTYAIGVISILSKADIAKEYYRCVDAFDKDEFDQGAIATFREFFNATGWPKDPGYEL